MQEGKVYDTENVPEDAEMFTKQGQDFDPIDASEIYQVELQMVELRDNPFYKPDAKEVKDQGSKYQFSFTWAIVNEGEFYGRRIWDTTSLAFKPDGKRGPTKLYKIVTAALKKTMSWEDCDKFAPTTKEFYSNLKIKLFSAQVRVAIENITNPETKKVRTKIVTYHEVKEHLPDFDPEKSKKMGEKIREKKAAAAKKNGKKEEISEDDVPF